MNSPFFSQIIAIGKIRQQIRGKNINIVLTFPVPLFLDFLIRNTFYNLLTNVICQKVKHIIFKNTFDLNKYFVI